MPAIAPALLSVMHAAHDQTAARVACGGTLVVGAPILAWSAFAFHTDGDAARAVVALWITALCAAALAASLDAAGVLTPTSRPVSWALLFAGAALLAPISLHGICDAPAWAPHVYDSFAGDRSFREWVCSSVILTGPAHISFAALCALRGYGLATGGPRPPRLVVAAAPVIVTVVIDAFFWSAHALFPAAYVAATALVLMPAFAFLERFVGGALPCPPGAEAHQVR